MNQNEYQATEEQLDNFKQLGEKATSQAGQVLSKLVNQDHVVNLSETHLSDPTKLYAQFGNSDNNVVTIVLRIDKDLNGYLVFVWSLDEAKRLASLLNKKDSGASLDDSELSSLKEICNIISSSLLQEITNTTGLNVIQSIPEAHVDMLKASLDEIGGQIALTSQNSLAFVAQVEVLPLNVAGYISFILDGQSSKKLLEGLSNG